MLSKSTYENVRKIIEDARNMVSKSVNTVTVFAYWEVGRTIVEDEQQGSEKAEYGKFLIKELAKKLTKEFGSGFEERSLRHMRQFYLTFPIRNTLRSELSWSHYRSLLRVKNEKAREYYISETVEQNWSVRALERQIGTLYYERLLSSQSPAKVEAEAKEKIKNLKNTPAHVLKDPLILEFLGIKNNDLLEKDLEKALIDKLQDFLLELGKGFAFVGRQKRVSTETKDFYIDLVFYNYYLNCFVLIDLKTNELTHQDIGQMEMYIRLFDDKVKKENDTPTIGLILCAEKDKTIVKYAMLEENEQLFASKYQFYLPTEDELMKEIEIQSEIMKNKKAHNNGSYVIYLAAGATQGILRIASPLGTIPLRDQNINEYFR